MGGLFDDSFGTTYVSFQVASSVSNTPVQSIVALDASHHPQFHRTKCIFSHPSLHCNHPIHINTQYAIHFVSKSSISRLQLEPPPTFAIMSFSLFVSWLITYTRVLETQFFPLFRFMIATYSHVIDAYLFCFVYEVVSECIFLGGFIDGIRGCCPY
jgi:hypothetical protein